LRSIVVLWQSWGSWGGWGSWGSESYLFECNSVLEQERAVALKASCDDFVRKAFREADVFEANEYIFWQGVYYVCDQLTSEPSSTQTEALAMTQAALDALPADWLASLNQATMECDLDSTLNLIAQIRFPNEPLASARRDLVINFQIEKLFLLIQSSSVYKGIILCCTPRYHQLTRKEESLLMDGTQGRNYLLLVQPA
jgi:hypothetical protein